MSKATELLDQLKAELETTAAPEDSLHMKYFVLDPEGRDDCAQASRSALYMYAQKLESLSSTHDGLVARLRAWVVETEKRASEPKPTLGLSESEVALRKALEMFLVSNNCAVVPAEDIRAILAGLSPYWAHALGQQRTKGSVL